MDYSLLGLSVINNFITEEQEMEIMSNIKRSKSKNGNGRNTVKRYGSDAPYKSNMISKKIPEFLEEISQIIIDKNLLEVKPDSVTINEYMIGQGIVPHIDSKESGPIITVLSLLGDSKMKFDKGNLTFTIDFPARCLVQMKGEIRDKWKHSVLPVKSERFSIVFRKST